jgi:hypothetical protein
MDNNWPIKWLELLRPILNGREYLEIFGEYKPIGFKARAMVSLAKINERKYSANNNYQSKEKY